MAAAPLVLASPRRAWLSVSVNVVAYFIMWVGLMVENLSVSLLLGALALVLAAVAGMPYGAKKDADYSVSAQIAVVVGVIAGLLAVYEYGLAPSIAVLVTVVIRLVLYTLGELIPPRKSSE